MHIGEKIKALRQAKLMTQSELAGNQITRNMLSSIEHGSALPSLPTAMYIAERLNVPVGYLLAGEEDELAYRKMSAMANIRRAYAARDWRGTLSLVNAAGIGRADDELSLIRAQCEFGQARCEIEAGHLRPAVAALDRALCAAEETVYDTGWLRRSIALYFRYLSSVSATLSSDILDADEVDCARAVGDPLSDYVMALDRAEHGEPCAAEYARQHPDALYADRLRALELMHNGDYEAAQTVLEALLARDELTFGVLLYEVFGDLELCYRKNDDYKRAYEFSGSRLGLLERLLEEV